MSLIASSFSLDDTSVLSFHPTCPVLASHLCSIRHRHREEIPCVGPCSYLRHTILLSLVDVLVSCLRHIPVCGADVLTCTLHSFSLDDTTHSPSFGLSHSRVSLLRYRFVQHARRKEIPRIGRLLSTCRTPFFSLYSTCSSPVLRVRSISLCSTARPSWVQTLQAFFPDVTSFLAFIQAARFLLPASPIPLRVVLSS